MITAHACRNCEFVTADCRRCPACGVYAPHGSQRSAVPAVDFKLFVGVAVALVVMLAVVLAFAFGVAVFFGNWMPGW